MVRGCHHIFLCCTLLNMILRMQKLQDDGTSENRQILSSGDDGSSSYESSRSLEESHFRNIAEEQFREDVKHQCLDFFSYPL